MKNIVYPVLAIISFICMSSCSAVPMQRRVVMAQAEPQMAQCTLPQQEGYAPPAMVATPSSSYMLPMQTNTQPMRSAGTTHGKIVEYGHQGGFIQRRHADGTPVGPPVWVPGPPPGKKIEGMKVNHLENTRMKDTDLQVLLQKYRQENPQ